MSTEGGVSPFPQVTVQGDREAVLDFLVEYSDGDEDQAHFLLSQAAVTAFQGHTPSEFRVTVDWVPRYLR